MFFGGKPKQEAVNMSALDSLINSSFDKKLAGLDSKASRTTKDLSSAKSRFGDACRKFEEVSAGPQLEYFFIDNVNFIKGQKLAYSKALRRIIADWDVSESKAPTIHGRYSEVLSSSERFIGEVLRANTNFKKVLQAYPGHLDLFKGSFSLIEKLTESLRTELNRASPALSEYRTLNSNLAKLHSLKEEAEIVERELIQVNEPAGSNAASVENSDEQSISDTISAKQRDLSDVNIESSLTHQKIIRLTAPLDRPSKKFDHTVQKKTALNTFIKDPMGNLNSEADYISFIGLLNEMSETVSAGSIEEKDRGRIVAEINELVNANIYELAIKYRKLGERSSSTREEIKSLEGRQARFREARSSSQRASESKESMKRHAEDVAKKIEASKEEIERLFEEYYNRRISITLSE